MFSGLFRSQHPAARSMSSKLFDGTLFLSSGEHEFVCKNIEIKDFYNGCIM